MNEKKARILSAAAHLLTAASDLAMVPDTSAESLREMTGLIDTALKLAATAKSA